MSIVVADCPRCATKSVTFDVEQSIQVNIHYGWQRIFEHFAVCRACHRATLLVGTQDKPDDRLTAQELPKIKTLNDVIRIENYISLKNQASIGPPEHLPPPIDAAFKEGAACYAIGCFNAAAAMFRLCLDSATRTMLPEEEAEGLNAKVRRDLGLRLPWLFKARLLPAELEGLSHCIREDGNDGAHAGNLVKADAEDILDFTTVFLTRLFTEPARLKLAAERRDARRNGK